MYCVLYVIETKPIGVKCTSLGRFRVFCLALHLLVLRVSYLPRASVSGVSRLSTRRVVVSACRAFVSPVSRLQVIRSDDLAPGRRALEQTKRNHLRTDGFTVNSAPALCTLQVQLSVQARRLSRLRLPPRTPRVRPLALPVSGTRVARRDVALTVAAYDARTATGRTVHPCTRSSQTATISAAYFLIL